MQATFSLTSVLSAGIHCITYCVTVVYGKAFSGEV